MRIGMDIQSALEKVLQTEYGLTVVEFTVLDTLSRQEGRYTSHLCPEDRRGIYTELTPAGAHLLEQASPGHNRILKQALDTAAAEQPELAPLLKALRQR